MTDNNGHDNFGKAVLGITSQNAKEPNFPPAKSTEINSIFVRGMDRKKQTKT